MFGKRTSFGGNTGAAASSTPAPAAPSTPAPSPAKSAAPAASAPKPETSSSRPRTEEVLDVTGADTSSRADNYFQTKSTIFSALIDSIDLSQLATMDADTAREEIRAIDAETTAPKSTVMSMLDQDDPPRATGHAVLHTWPLGALPARHASG